ncbi:hypothetical protein ACFVTE_09130 [Arthrobacter sp. NPDC058097]
MKFRVLHHFCALKPLCALPIAVGRLAVGALVALKSLTLLDAS